MTDPTHRFRAFISYSHRDTGAVRWLHRALETYRVPRKLLGRETAFGPVPKTLAPIFRDRDELSASPDLSAELRAALAQSLFLIVVCSPAAAASRYVNEEVLIFKRLHGEKRVLALIVAGEPGVSQGSMPSVQECFPPALRFSLAADGTLSDVAAAPIAADLRKIGDGRRLALLKLIAALTGLRLDELAQREAQRRAQRLRLVAGASLTACLFTGGLAIYANVQRIEAERQRRVAEKESAASKATADFLISTFTLSNPATENPRTITALTILGRSADRSRSELRGQPDIQARLLTTIVQAYNNLGLLNEARAAMEPSLVTIRALGPDGAEPLLALATTYMREGNLTDAARTTHEAGALLGPDLAMYPTARGHAAEIMGVIDDDELKLTQSIADYDRALKFYAAVPDIDAQIIARTLNNRGAALSDKGRYHDADESLLKANAIWRRTLGDSHLKVGQSYFALAQNALSAGQLTEAETYAGKSLAILEPVLERNNPLVADALVSQGAIYEAQKRPAEAKVALSAAIQRYKDSYHAPHYSIGIAEVYLSMAESELGETAKALETIDDAKIQYDVGYGHLHANHGDRLVYRAMILKHSGRIDDARRDCSEGLAIIAKTSEVDSALYKADSDMCAGL
jgi:tetratricopeptide (TPR) repeat protein